MLSVYSPFQVETTSSFPFHTEKRQNLASESSHHQSHSLPQQQHQQQHLTQRHSSSPSNSKPAYNHSTSFDADKDCNDDRSFVEQHSVNIEDMIPAQSQAEQPPMYNTFYSSADYSSVKAAAPPHYIHHSRSFIPDRRQSAMPGYSKIPSGNPSLSDARARPQYSTQAAHSPLSDGGVSSAVSAPQPVEGTWTSAAAPAPVSESHGRTIDSYSSDQPNLPPLSEALHGLTSENSSALAGTPSTQTQQATLTTMSSVVGQPPNFYAQTTYLDMQAPVNVYPSQDQFEGNADKMVQQQRAQDQFSTSAQSMVAQETSVGGGTSGYVRRVTYPFVPSLETDSGLVMPNVIPSEPTGSSPLNNSTPFSHGGLVGANAVPVQNMPRASPAVGYMDSLTLQQNPIHAHAHAQQAQVQAQQAQVQAQQAQVQAQQHASAMHPVAWSQDSSGDMSGVDGANGSKVYSFVPLTGSTSKKRPRRRFDEIERLYVCNWGDCTKAYGTLNHLNAHVHTQKHGPKRLPAEFKELRKAWRRHKRAEEEAARQAAAFHQQQSQSQHAQLPPQLCDPVLAHMHPPHHTLNMHSMSQHQPHQIPHPHAHPNPHPHAHPHSHHSQSSQSHSQHHQMGF